MKKCYSSGESEYDSDGDEADEVDMKEKFSSDHEIFLKFFPQGFLNGPRSTNSVHNPLHTLSSCNVSPLDDEVPELVSDIDDHTQNRTANATIQDNSCGCIFDRGMRGCSHVKDCELLGTISHEMIQRRIYCPSFVLEYMSKAGYPELCTCDKSSKSSCHVLWNGSNNAEQDMQRKKEKKSRKKERKMVEDERRQAEKERRVKWREQREKAKRSFDIDLQPQEPVLAAELIDDKKQERLHELEELRKKVEQTAEEQDSKEVVGRCISHHLGRCPEGSRGILIRQERFELTCSLECRTMYHSSCFSALLKLQLAKAGWQLAKGVPCLTPDCGGVLLRACVRESNKKVTWVVGEPGSKAGRMEASERVNSKQQNMGRRKQNRGKGSRWDGVGEGVEEEVETEAEAEVEVDAEEAEDMGAEERTLFVGGEEDEQGAGKKGKGARPAVAASLDKDAPLQVYVKEEVGEQPAEGRAKCRKAHKLGKARPLKLALEGPTEPEEKLLEGAETPLSQAEQWERQMEAMAAARTVQKPPPKAAEFPPLPGSRPGAPQEPPAPSALDLLKPLIVDPCQLLALRPVFVLLEHVDPQVDELALASLLSAASPALERLQRFRLHDLAVVAFSSFDDAFLAAAVLNGKLLGGQEIGASHFLKKMPEKDHFSRQYRKPFRNPSDPLPAWQAPSSSSQAVSTSAETPRPANQRASFGTPQGRHLETQQATSLQPTLRVQSLNPDSYRGEGDRVQGAPEGREAYSAAPKKGEQLEGSANKDEAPAGKVLPLLPHLLPKVASDSPPLRPPQKVEEPTFPWIYELVGPTLHRVRSAPSSDAPEIGVLGPKTLVVAVERSQNWIRILSLEHPQCWSMGHHLGRVFFKRVAEPSGAEQVVQRMRIRKRTLKKPASSNGGLPGGTTVQAKERVEYRPAFSLEASPN